jgi:hypothetical protein
MLLTYPAQAANKAEEIKTALATTYKLTNFGIARQLLGIEINRNEDGTISLRRRRFICSVLKRFHTEKAYDATTPLDDKGHSCHVDTGGGVYRMLRGFERWQMAVAVMQRCQTQSKRRKRRKR